MVGSVQFQIRCEEFVMAMRDIDITDGLG